MRDSYRSIYPANMSLLASCRPQRFLDAVEVMGKDSEGKGRSEGNFAVSPGWLRWESTISELDTKDDSDDCLEKNSVYQPCTAFSCV